MWNSNLKSCNIYEYRGFNILGYTCQALKFLLFSQALLSPKVTGYMQENF